MKQSTYDTQPQEPIYGRRGCGRRKRRRRSWRRIRSLVVLMLAFVAGFYVGGMRTALGFHQVEPAPTEQEEPAKESEHVEWETILQADPLETEQETGASAPGETSAEHPEAPFEHDWQLVLVNADTPLSQDFEVPQLTQLKNGQAIDSRAYPDLQRMMDDARAAGLQPLICSSFRTWTKQEELFQRKVSTYLKEGVSQEEAEQMAAVWVARPGTSEHQLGLAVDIVSKEYQVLDEAQEDTPLQQWLMEHCWEYGFILRYPSEKSNLTGIGYEPWHYRYVGKDFAEEITTKGLCLEEYLGESTY